MNGATRWLLATLASIVCAGAAGAQEPPVAASQPEAPSLAAPPVPAPVEEPELEDEKPPPPLAASPVDAPAPVPPCALPERDRAPDPRCGENLDGRPPEPGPSAGTTAARAALWVPKGAALVAVWPFVHGTGFVERHDLQGWFQAAFTSDDGRVGVRPELTVSSGLLPAVGGRLFYRRLPGEGTEVVARFLTAGPPVVFGQLQFHLPSWTGLSVAGTFDHRIDRVFGGIGAVSRSTLEEQGHAVARYGANVLRGEVAWNRPLPYFFRTLVHVDLQRRDYESDKVRAGPSVADAFGLPPVDCAALGVASPCVNPLEMPGFYQGLRVLHGGVGFGWDARSRLRGGSGVSAFVDATPGIGVSSDPTRDVRFSGEAAATIGGVDRALLLRAWAAMVEPLAGTIVPFDELISPCGNLALRGFPEGRFRGQSGAVGTVEYRYYIAWNLDATVFSDVGTVAGPRFDGLFSARWFPDFGVGLRFYTPSGRHWEAPPMGGLQVVYAPDNGVRVLLALASF